MSLFYITDGNVFLPLIPAKDYKRAYDDDKGENTGGMGSYAPHMSLSNDLQENIDTHIVQNVIRGLKDSDIPYRGVLYIGIIITEKGPQVLEFNCRFGDPETQVLLPLIDSDFVSLCYNAATANLSENDISWKEQYAACVVIASDGYPGSYKKGMPISFTCDPFDFIHAGTRNENGSIVTNGGRVLNAVALGKNKQEALDNAYALAKKVQFEGSFYRKDIGK